MSQASFPLRIGETPLGGRHFPDRVAWRKWLQKHHASSDGLWMISFKKATGKAGVLYDEAVEEALCFGWIDSTVRRVDEERTAQRFGPRRDPTNWSPSNLDRMKRLLAHGLVTEAGMAKFKPASKKRRPRVPTSSDAPADLAARLATAPDAAAFWGTLAPGYRRLYVGWILNAKKPETRTRRVESTMMHLRKKVKNAFM